MTSTHKIQDTLNDLSEFKITDGSSFHLHASLDTDSRFIEPGNPTRSVKEMLIKSVCIELVEMPPVRISMLAKASTSSARTA